MMAKFVFDKSAKSILGPESKCRMKNTKIIAPARELKIV